jgi:ferric-dicitrate binding protein FerR (iron transport regulator)
VQWSHPSPFGAKVTALAPRATLAAHDSLASGAAGGALLRLGPGLTLRLAAGSRLAFDAAGSVTLEAGTVYVDADPARGPQPLAVGTRWGVVSHLGTQYSVGADGARLEVAVREGRVRLARDGAAPVEARRGELLRVATSGAVQRETLARDDARWAWIADLPTAFDTDGASLAGFLAWYARETGRGVVFADPADAARAADVRLAGSIAGLAPEQALDVVAASTGLDVQRDAARLVLRLP